MAVNLSIKSVPDQIAARLRERAQRNHRSLQGELIAIIEAAADATQCEALPTATPMATRGTVVGFDRRGCPIVRKGSRPIEEIAAELRRRAPAPRRDLPRSVDIIRDMRDSR